MITSCALSSLPQPSKTVVKIKQQPEDYIVWIATADHRQSVQAYKRSAQAKGTCRFSRQTMNY